MLVGCSRGGREETELALGFVSPTNEQELSAGPVDFELTVIGIEDLTTVEGLALASDQDGILTGDWEISGNHLVFHGALNAPGAHQVLAVLSGPGGAEADATVRVDVTEDTEDTSAIDDTEDTSDTVDTGEVGIEESDGSCYFHNFFPFLRLPADRLPLYWDSDADTRDAARTQDTLLILEAVPNQGSVITGAWLDASESEAYLQSAHLETGGSWEDSDYLLVEANGRWQVKLTSGSLFEAGDSVAVDVICDDEITRANSVLPEPVIMPALPVAIGNVGAVSPWTSGNVTFDPMQDLEVQVIAPLDEQGEPLTSNDFWIDVSAHGSSGPPMGAINFFQFDDATPVDGVFTFTVPASAFPATAEGANGPEPVAHYGLGIGFRGDHASSHVMMNLVF